MITISVRESESVDRWDDDLDGLEGFLVDIVERGGKKREINPAVTRASTSLDLMVSGFWGFRFGGSVLGVRFV